MLRRAGLRSTTMLRGAPAGPANTTDLALARDGEVVLGHFRADLVRRQAHQSCGDFGLLGGVVGQTLGGENRLAQGRRLDPHAPRSVLGFPSLIVVFVMNFRSFLT